MVNDTNMACNSCSKTFSLLRKEKGCPACGFSYCSNCLKYKLFVPKLNSEVKVCAKCERTANSNEKTNIEPPDAYYKRIGAMNSETSNKTFNSESGGSKDQEIMDRLSKLKEDIKKPEKTTNEDIANRLQKIKGEAPTTSDADLQLRLANLKGVPVATLQNKPVLLVADSKTEQEQVDDLMKQYMEQAKIDGVYEDNFQGVLSEIQTRLQKLKGPGTSTGSTDKKASDAKVEIDDEEIILKQIIEKAKAESRLEIENQESELDELPFCEICNEDAKMRCLGCKYLFCKRCFMEHKDDDDGCDKYELYRSPRNDK